MDTSFAPDAQVFTESDDYMIIDRRVPFSNTASNVRTSIFRHSGNDAPLTPSLDSQQTYLNLSSFEVSGSEPSTLHTLESREREGVSTSYEESHINLDGDELSARLLFLAERTPMSREDILFGSFMEVEGSEIIPQWQHTNSTFTPSGSSSTSSAYTEDTLVTPPNRTVPPSNTLLHSFEPVFPRYFQHQSSVPRRQPAPGSIDHPHSPLSYKSPLMEHWRDDVLSPSILFDCDADPGTNGGLGISNVRSKVTKRARNDDDEERDSQRKKRGDNRWRMYC